MSGLPDNFSWQNGQLYAENVDIAAVAQVISTPFYCYSAGALKHSFVTFQAALQTALENPAFNNTPLVAYALKANSSLAVLHLLAAEGAGADVVSEGELRRALAAGIAPQKIVFSGVGKNAAEMDFALNQNILCFNVESVPELLQLAARAKALECRAPVSLRINPDIDAPTHAKIATGHRDNKFGISYDEARNLYAQAAAMTGIKIRGIDVHIGSQICDLAPFDHAFARIRDLVNLLREDGLPIEHIDVGGGLGIGYDETTKPPSVTDYARLICQHFGGLGVKIICEPGRAIVGNAGILVMSVLYCKQAGAKNFIIVDAAMNDMLRPTLYEATHRILPVRQKSGQANAIRADIVGPVCESGDYLGRDICLAQPKAGDLLAMFSAGAYGSVMASSYNCRALIPEVLVAGDSFDLVRRRPSHEEMLALEQIPAWLRCLG